MVTEHKKTNTGPNIHSRRGSPIWKSLFPTVFRRNPFSKSSYTYSGVTIDVSSCGVLIRMLTWLMNLMDREWQKNEKRKMVSSVTYFNATMNSPWAPKTVSFSGFFTLYVLLMTAASPEQRRIDVVAIKVDPMIVFLSDWTARMFFLSLSCQMVKDNFFFLFYPHC
jgi:hypothetical protein